MKKTTTIIAIALSFILIFTGCGDKGFDVNGDISVYSREAGSGTRGAFIELFSIEQKNEAGKKVDMTINTADTTNSTQVMLTSIAANRMGIGYVSLGVLNDSVKALDIDGVSPNVANIKSGAYKIARPFLVVTKEGLSALGEDFMAFILSGEGQKIVEDKGYIRIDELSEYSGTKPTGKIVIGGSSSVSPVMEKLVEAYREINPNADIELSQSDSTTGVTGVIDDVLDIGMASRELKENELEKGVSGTPIAIDGIAVIVNTENTLNGLTSENVKDIYTGRVTTWSLS